MKKLVLIGICLAMMGCTKEEPVIIEDKNKEEIIVEEVKEVDDLSELNQMISDYMQTNALDASMVSYAIQDLQTGKITGSSNMDENFIAGSVYKLPLCMLWYDRIDQGLASASQPLYYSESCNEPGGQIEKDFQIGSYIPLSTVLAYTLIYSDNAGGHILFESFGGWTEYKKQAANYSSHPQNEEFFSLSNYLNAQYMCDVMKRIYDNQELYKDVIEYLRIASPDDYLNHTIQVDMVQKVGWCENFVNSCGLSLNGHPYSLCVFTAYNNYGLTVMGDINQICYNYFNQ